MIFQATHSFRWIVYGLFSLLCNLSVLGCATFATRTQSEQAALTWEATELHLQTSAIEERETYTFTLLLRSTQDTPVTFTRLSARFQNSPGGPPVSWEKIGTWTIPAHGDLRLPLGSTRHCRYATCYNLGPLTPTWSIMLTGPRVQGAPGRTAIDLRLPAITATTAAR